MSNEGKKYDEGKLRWDLLPLDLVEKIVEVYTFGAKKYEPNSWQNLEDGYNRYKAAMFRHLLAFEKGHIVDDESGLPHLAHCCWNAIAMMYMSKKDSEIYRGPVQKYHLKKLIKDIEYSLKAVKENLKNK